MGSLLVSYLVFSVLLILVDVIFNIDRSDYYQWYPELFPVVKSRRFHCFVQTVAFPANVIRLGGFVYRHWR